MSSGIASLPRDPDILIEMIAGLRAENEKLRAMLETLKRALYGARSEKRDADEAQLAFGDYSPSGKLPASFDRRWEDNSSYKSYYPNVASDPKGVKYSEGVFVGYRHYDKDGVKPLFPFGYGLSYTTFKYSNLSVTPAAFKQGRDVTVSFDVTNTGSREGAEIDVTFVVVQRVQKLGDFVQIGIAQAHVIEIENTRPGPLQQVERIDVCNQVAAPVQYLPLKFFK